MGYGNWTEIKIANTSDVPIQFANSGLSWGKFYSCEPSSNKDAEISPDGLNKTTIDAGRTYTIGSCGRENTWSGTEGHFDLASNQGLTIAKFKFYSPHGTSYNSFNIDCPNPGVWSATATGGDFGNGGPLGSITVTVKKVGA
ncbi:hypothetical protein HWV62_41812 [Athelia sp. TMB]|nr:hypothetical protein HWV62_7495 [Athelia sp. TMB]KAF7965780.1 hypothetical protein HWV62_41812 [Athelia sp. TMB]